MNLLDWCFTTYKRLVLLQRNEFKDIYKNLVSLIFIILGVFLLVLVRLTICFLKCSWNYLVSLFFATVCNIDETRCDNGACVYRENWCDGINNCHDNSDETNCNGEISLHILAHSRWILHYTHRIGKADSVLQLYVPFCDTSMSLCKPVQSV